MVFAVENNDKLWTANLKCENCHAGFACFLNQNEYKEKRLGKWCKECNEQYLTVMNVQEFLF